MGQENETTEVTVEITEPQEPQPQEPTSPPTSENQILLGELKAKVEALETLTQEQKQQIEGLQMENRWKEDSDQSLRERVWQMDEEMENIKNQIASVKIDLDESDMHDSESSNEIPVIPDPVDQGEPEQVAKSRRAWFW